MKQISKIILFAVIVLNVFLTPLSVIIIDKNSNKQNTLITLQKNNIYALTTTTATTPTEKEPEIINAPEKKVGYMECVWYDMACHGINFLQLIAVSGGNALVAISASFMDYFLQHSIQSSSYRDAGFIEQGWEILRDVTNIVFIFALLYIAFQMVLDAGKGDAKKRLMKVILVTLVINFSLFVAYAVIDVSNIFAHVFYNKITQQEVSYDLSSPDGEYNIKPVEAKKSTSLAIARKINPQGLLMSSDTGKETYNKGQRIILVIMIGIINGTLIYTFLSIGFLFLGRTIGLWFSAILSPLAFASITVPALEKIDYIGFDKWLSSLLKASFMAPIFIFILYLAVQFMNIDPVAGYNSSGAFIDKIIALIIPMAAIIVLILVGKKVATAMSGDFAGIISEYVAKGIGGAVAIGSIAATGGASLATGTLGRLGTSKLGRKLGAEKLGTKLRSASKVIGSSKFDVSKIPGFKTAFGKEATSFTSKISGRSALGHISAGKTYMQKTQDDVFDNETDKIGKENVARAKAAAQRKTDKGKSAADWQKEVEKEKDKARADVLASETKKDLGDKFKKEQDAEKKAYREMQANPDLVKKEEKTLKGFTKEISDLTAQFNSAKGNGLNTTTIEMELGAKIVQEHAFKNGVDITTGAIHSYAGPGLDIKEAKQITKDNKNGFGSTSDYISSIGGTDISDKTFKSAYGKTRDEVQKAETTEIKSQISKLRGTADKSKNQIEKDKKDADLLSKKFNDIISDSQRDDKKGNFDKDNK